MADLCDGQVVIVTGGGRGIGRAHALAFARAGAKVVVNDLGTTYTGAGVSSEPAEEVADEIKALGGEAIVSVEDITDPVAAQRIVSSAIETFGDLTTVVNNAGILRSHPITEMRSEDILDAFKVHVLGAFHLTKYAAEYWLPRIEAGEKLNASIINTSSAAGLWPSTVPPIPGWLSAYGTVKGAAATLTQSTSLELSPQGIRVNAIAPGGRTRMNTEAIADLLGAPIDMPAPTEGFDLMDPANVSPLVVWLSTPEAADISGRVFESGAGRIAVVNGWGHGPSEARMDRAWDPAELGPIVRGLLAKAPEPETMMHGA
jgi:NAD(P)-dependent dehydrogenase (short-subunit alcohol dehydrogenase family)